MSTNLKIISELKYFIQQTASSEDLRRLFFFSDTSFTRVRKLGFEQLVYLMLNFFKRSYSVEIAEFYRCIGLSELMVSKSAFCQQRMKLKSCFYVVLNQLLVQRFYHYYQRNIKRWKGFRLIAVDGSSAYLMDKPEVIAYFGCQPSGVKDIAMAQLVKAVDVLNGFCLWAEMLPLKASEQQVAQRYLPIYEPDMLLLYDRGFPGFTTLFLHQVKEVPQPFVVRCPVGFTKEISAFVNSNENDTLSVLRSNQQSSARLRKQGFIVPIGSTIYIRLIKIILDDGTIEVLATNLFDNANFPVKLFKNLYALRWGVEISYDTLKNKLQLQAFSGQKPLTLLQDFHTSIFLSNLQQLLAKPCQEQLNLLTKNRKLKYHINRNIAFGIMKNRVVELFWHNNPAYILEELQNIFLKNLEPDRPGRKFVRTRKMAWVKSKHYTQTNYKRAF